MQFGEFFVSRFTLVLLEKLHTRASDYIKDTHLIEREPDKTSLLRQGLEDLLTNPPDGIRYKLEPAGGVKLKSSLHQANVPLIHQVKEIQTSVLILLGHGYHEAKIRLYHTLKGSVITGLDTDSELGLLFRSNHLQLAKITEVIIDGLSPGHHRGHYFQLSHRFNLFSLIHTSTRGFSFT